MPIHIPVKEIELSSWSINEDDGHFHCDHEFTHIEQFEVDTMRNGEHDTYNVPGYVCDDCDEVLEDREVDDERDYCE